MDDTGTKSIFDDEADEAEDTRLDAEADAEIEAGRFVRHADVVKWLQSWGTQDKLPRPRSRP